MEDNVWRPAHLTPQQMEERRLVAARLLRQGRLSQAQIARQLGASRASVSRWAATLAQEGRRGLEARPIPGRSPRLNQKAWVRLGRLLDRGAVAAGFPTERWTLKRIAALIEREFGCTIIRAIWSGPSRRMASACSVPPQRPRSAMSSSLRRGPSASGSF